MYDYLIFSLSRFNSFITAANASGLTPVSHNAIHTLNCSRDKPVLSKSLISDNTDDHEKIDRDVE